MWNVSWLTRKTCRKVSRTHSAERYLGFLTAGREHAEAPRLSWVDSGVFTLLAPWFLQLAGCPALVRC